MVLVYIQTVSVTQVGVWVLRKERGCPVAAMPNKVVRGGGNGLGGELVAVHTPIYPVCPNVRGGETPRVGLPAGGESGSE